MSDAVERARILVVDDDPMIRHQVGQLFGERGYTVEQACDVGDAIGRLEQEDFDVALVDLRMPGGDGLSLIGKIRQDWPDIDVIMVTAHGSIKQAVEAMSKGACDFITKPIEPIELLKAAEKAIERRQLLSDNATLRDDNAYLRRELSERHSFASMVTCSPVMGEVFSTIEMLAASDVTVVIIGESGTGKELAARAIHFQGKRREGRFVAINCAALPETLLESELFGYERGAFTGAVQDRVGKIELANGGTLFLDEVESIPLGMQAKLLRVLEDRSIERLGSNKRIAVDMRVVCATNQDLSQAVANQQMREDFYYRINVVPIHLPPLRERLADIPYLSEDFLSRNPLAVEKGILRLSHHAIARLSTHHWPGNIRELRNVLERAVLRCKGTLLDDVDVPVGTSVAPVSVDDTDFRQSLKLFMRSAERRYLTWMLKEFGGGISPAARHAAIDQATLHRKIRLHRLNPGEFRDGRGGALRPLSARNAER